MAIYLLHVYRLPVVGLGLFLLATGCASTEKAKIPDKDQKPTEQLLLLPIQLGHAGLDQIVRNLQRRYGVDAGTGLSTRTNASHSITLEDGTVVTQALTGMRPHSPSWDEIAFDLKAEPCLRIERALALTGATRVGESAGSDLVSASVTYQLQTDDIRMDITTYAPNPQCVGSVWIYKVSPQKAPSPIP